MYVCVHLCVVCVVHNIVCRRKYCVCVRGGESSILSILCQCVAVTEVCVEKGLLCLSPCIHVNKPLLAQCNRM